MQKTLSKRSPWAQKAIRIIKKRDAIKKGEEEEEEEKEAAREVEKGSCVA